MFGAKKHALKVENLLLVLLNALGLQKGPRAFK